MEPDTEEDDMKTFTRATVLGHIGSEVVMRHTKGGTPVVNLSIATNVRRKDGVEETTWHRAVLWDRLAEFAGDKLAKGEPVLLEGRLSTNDWVDGEGIKRSRTEIVAYERLYGADLSEWLEIIQGFDDALDRVMCVGHNPGLTELVSYFSSEGIGHVPTCGVVELRFDIWRWALVGRVEPTGVDFDYPKRVIS